MEAEKVKSCPPYPDDEEGDQWHHNEKMDIEEITEEESAGGNFDEPRNIHRNDSPHIDVEEHVSDIDSQYVKLNYFRAEKDSAILYIFN